MANGRKAFELPYLFGGASTSMPDAQCNVSYGCDCQICQGGFTDEDDCIDVPGGCQDLFDGGLALGGGLAAGGFVIWAT